MGTVVHLQKMKTLKKQIPSVLLCQVQLECSLKLGNNFMRVAMVTRHRTQQDHPHLLVRQPANKEGSPSNAENGEEEMDTSNVAEEDCSDEMDLS